MVGEDGKLIELAHCRVLWQALILDKFIHMVSHSEHFINFSVLPLHKNFAVSLLFSSSSYSFTHSVLILVLISWSASIVFVLSV